MKNKNATLVGRQGFAPILMLFVAVLIIAGVWYFGVNKERTSINLTQNNTDDTSPLSKTEKIEFESGEIILENGWIRFTNKNQSQWRKYSISRPKEWSVNKYAFYDTDYKDYGNHVSISNNGNTIEISQDTAGVGGGECPSDAKEIGGEHGLFRFRSENPATITYWICQGASAITDAGIISYVLESDDGMVLQEMDSILKTLQIEDY